MRSILLSLILGLGVVGLSLGAPSQARADDFRGPAYTRDVIPVSHHWRGWSHYYYPGLGYGYYGGYPYGGWGYPYGGFGLNGGYRSYYSPWGYGGYGGYYNWGNRFGRLGPFSGYSYSPGYYWW
jgi:hypothetical protein